MINLRCAVRVETIDIDTIIGEKRAPNKIPLTNLKAKILERYAKYIDLETSGRIKPIAFTVDDKNALLSLYGSQTRTARLITDQVLNIVDPTHGDRCPYCGLGEFDEIDHYLPKEHFPEFSILHKNLVPICGKCNEIKSDYIPGQDGKDYLHLIYDLLPIEDIYNCTLTFNNQVPEVDFAIIPRFMTSLIYTHFDGLKLKTRMESKAVQYCLQIKACKDKFGTDFAKVELARDLLKIREFFGSFYWKTKLIEEMTSLNYVDCIA